MRKTSRGAHRRPKGSTRRDVNAGRRDVNAATPRFDQRFAELPTAHGPRRASTPHGDTESRRTRARRYDSPQTRGSFCVSDTRFGFTTKTNTTSPAADILHRCPWLLRLERLPLLEQLDADAVGTLHERHLPVPGRPVDHDTLRLQRLAKRIDVVGGVCKMAHAPRGGAKSSPPQLYVSSISGAPGADAMNTNVNLPLSDSLRRVSWSPRALKKSIVASRSFTCQTGRMERNDLFREE